ncbi:MAG: ATP-binding protein [Spirochaetaceae bacterium]|jgi:predicted AAA+ superfamily ATPase|nr:ATP-binding protein [Spirochaetaceae bacterium]
MNNNSKAMCEEALACLAGLSIFSALKKKPIVRFFKKILLQVVNDTIDPLKLIQAWAEFTGVFARDNPDKTFYMYWLDLVLADENTFTLCAERGQFDENSLLSSLTRSDLRRLSIIGDFDIPMLALFIADILWKADYRDSAQLIEEGVRSLGELRLYNEKLSINTFPYTVLQTQNIRDFANFLKEHGAGELARHTFFSWKENQGLVPARNPDTITLDDLSDYEEQRRIVVDNTIRFLEGKGEVNNILLYGDRGTGKSATVKAICNSFSSRGLRLVELHKQDMSQLTCILSTLASRGLRFVLFIDDLSFESQNDSYNSLKALLEGGIEAKPGNIVIYATSNRRHLVKEQVQDRPDSTAFAASIKTGDMRAFDTMQEQLSLADRFGLTVIFAMPSQDDYLRIAEFIAERRGLLHKDSPTSNLKHFREGALKWERWFNGRSPRTARQYVDWFSGGGGFPWE